MTLLRSVNVEQPDFQWQFQLRHERDVTAQLEAIAALEKYPTPATRMALTDTIENEQCFYKVRCKAAHCLTTVIFSIDIMLISLLILISHRLQMQWCHLGKVHQLC